MPELLATYENLAAAYSGESWLALNISSCQPGCKTVTSRLLKYSITSGNEKEHAKIWYKLLNGGSVGDTMTNLALPPKAKTTVWTSMYKEFAGVEKGKVSDIGEKFKASAPWKRNTRAILPS